MKIILVGNSGISIYKTRLELVERLIHDGHEVVIVIPESEFVEELRQLGCRIVFIELSRHGKNPFSDLKLLKGYKKIFVAEKPDYVFTYTIKPNIYAAWACKKLNIPCIANITGLGTAVENRGLLQLITVFLYKIAFKKIQTVFFQNAENMKFFADKKIALGKHKLLPGSGVNLEKFVPLDFPDDERIGFVFIARIMKEKGIEEYLAAAQFIKKKYPDTEFHICGFCEKEYDGKLSELASGGVVIYHGMVKDTTEILRQVQCTILPTYYPEGMSNVLLESCASCRPIITTDRSGCREIVDDGVNGYVCKKQDKDDLIEKIEKFLSLTNAERKEMGIQGRKKVEAEFDRQIVVSAYIDEIGKNQIRC